MAGAFQIRRSGARRLAAACGISFVAAAGAVAQSAAPPAGAAPGAAVGQSPAVRAATVLPATTAAASPLVDKARDSGGAIVIPMNARAGTPAMFVPTGAERQLAAQAAEGGAAGRPTAVRYESLMRAGDHRYSITTLRDPERERFFRERQSPYWRPAAGRVGPSSRAPAIGEPGFDPFNSVHRSAQLRFGQTAAAGSTARADRGHREAQLRFNRAATSGSTRAADEGLRRAPLNFHRAATEPSRGAGSR